MKELKIKAEIEFTVSVYDLEELKEKTDKEIAKYILDDIGNKIHNVSDLYMDCFVEDGLSDGSDIALCTGKVEIINTSVEEVLESEFINSLKK